MSQRAVLRGFFGSFFPQKHPQFELLPLVVITPSGDQTG